MATLYIRPAFPVTTYGSEDGSSYANALNGIQQFFVEGNTYLVAGLHLPAPTSFSTNSLGVSARSGTVGNRTTLRGDADEEVGKVVDGHIPAYATWTNEGGGVWSYVQKYNMNAEATWFFEGMTLSDDGNLLTKVASLSDCTDLPASHFSAGGEGVAYKTNEKVYIHLTSGNQPSNVIGHGDALVIHQQGHNILYKQGPISFFDMINMEYIGALDLDSNEADGVFSAPNNCSWLGGRYEWGVNIMFEMNQECTGCVWDGVEMGHGGNGVYFVSDRQNSSEGLWSDMSITNCDIHHMGLLERGNGFDGADAHGVGVQGGDGLTIDSNTFSYCGNTIAFYAFRGGVYHQTMKNMTVTNNAISDIHIRGTSEDTVIGITLTGDNDNLGDKTGYLIDNNTIDMGGIGTCIRCQFEHPNHPVITNNILKNAFWGIKGTRSWTESPGGAGNQYAPDFKAHGNTFQSIAQELIHINSGNAAGDPGHIIDSDNNLFQIDTGQSVGDDLFRLNPNDQTLTEWQANVKGTNVYDPNSTMGVRVTSINTAEKRKAAAGVPFLPFGPGVTPESTKDEAWRRQSGWGYLLDAGAGLPAGTLPLLGVGR